jgi:hypothetical protein
METWNDIPPCLLIGLSIFGLAWHLPHQCLYKDACKYGNYDALSI